MSRAVAFALIAAVMAPTARGEGLRVGAAAVVITPPPGTPLAGYYSERAAEGVHDDLFAKAIVLESDGRSAALVGLDLISTTRDLVAAARRLIDEQTGVPGPAVMISATHSHTGPVLAGRGRREQAMGGGSPLARRYMDDLPGRIAEAVRLAESRLAPASVEFGRGHEASIAFNRRFHMTDGTVGWNPGKLNPRIIKPAGPIDPDVPYVFFATTERKPIAAYVNYAVHLDNVGGPEISADMPYTLSRLLGEFHGPELVTLFTAGCCGDINHVDVSCDDPQKGHANAARMGVVLAGEVLSGWLRMEPLEPGPLRVLSETVELPPAPYDAADLAEAEAIAGRKAGDPGPAPTFLQTVKAYKVLDVAAREGRPWQVEVQVVALGDDLAWVSLPGEIFVDLGLAIKQDSPIPRTIIAELANGAIGYIPSRRAYPQGNYEVVSARCAEGSGELLVAAALRLLKQVYADQNPPAGD